MYFNIKKFIKLQLHCTSFPKYHLLLYLGALASAFHFQVKFLPVLCFKSLFNALSTCHFPQEAIPFPFKLNLFF